MTEGPLCNITSSNYPLDILLDSETGREGVVNLLQSQAPLSAFKKQLKRLTGLNNSDNYSDNKLKEC